MTCIAVVRDKVNNKIWMAGDRAISDDNTVNISSSPKIWKKEGYLFGYAGSMDGDRIRHLFVPPQFEGRGSIDKFMYSKFLKALRNFYEGWWVDTSTSSDFGMIICVRGKIYEHNAADMSLTQYEQDYLAMGSGGDLALGSLYSTQKQKDARKRAVLAVNAAITHSTSCKGPIDILSIQGYTKYMNHMGMEDLSPEEQEFGIWLENGIERGWISGPYCHTHDGGYQYMSEEEVEEWEAGGDPCEHVVRIFL